MGSAWCKLIFLFIYFFLKGKTLKALAEPESSALRQSFTNHNMNVKI